MTHVFISYSRKDAPFANELKEQLQNAGFDHWIDRDKLKATHNWVEEIPKAIHSAYALIVIKSPASNRSPYVTAEWAFAWGKGVPIIAILYTFQKTTNALLKPIQHLDFTDPANMLWQELFDALAETRNQFGIKIRVPNGVPPKVRAALEKLNSDFTTEVLDGVQLLGKLLDPITVDALILILDHEDENVVNVATEALLKMGDEVIDRLTREFVKEDQSENRRYKISIVLAETKSDTALNCFLEALQDKREHVRYLAINGLASLGRMEAVEFLISLLHNPDHKVRTQVVIAFSRLAWRVYDSVDNPAFKSLIEALNETLNNDAETNVRSSAATSLGDIGSVLGVSSLRKALDDIELPVRIATAKSLGEIGDEIAVDDLFSLSADKDILIRQAGLDALNSMSNRGSTKAREAVAKWPPQT